MSSWLGLGRTAQRVALLAFLCFGHLLFVFSIFPLQYGSEWWPYADRQEDKLAGALQRVVNTNLSFSDAMLDDIAGVHRNLLLLGAGEAPNSCFYCRFGNVGTIVPASLVSSKSGRGALLSCPLNKLGDHSSQHLRRIISEQVELLRWPMEGKRRRCPTGADFENSKFAAANLSVALRVADWQLSTQVATRPAETNASINAPQTGSTPHKGFLCICTRIWKQGEVDGLPPWIEFHVLFGVEHFFVYFSRLNASALREQLAPYLEAGLLTLVPWERPFEDKPAALHQTLAVNHCLQVYARPSFAWALLTDPDEYVRTFNQNETMPAVIRRTANASVLVLQNCDFSQRVFDGHGTGMVLDHYRERMVDPCNGRYKVLMQSDLPMLWDIHRVTGARMQLLEPSDVRLNHYDIIPRIDRTRFRNKTEDHLLADRLSQRLRQRLEQRLGPAYSPPPLAALEKTP